MESRANGSLTSRSAIVWIGAIRTPRSIETFMRSVLGRIVGQAGFRAQWKSRVESQAFITHDGAVAPTSLDGGAPCPDCCECTLAAPRF